MEMHGNVGIESRLLDRRRRLETAVRQSGRRPDLLTLLAEVDEAIGRLGAGTFGLCATCKEAIPRVATSTAAATHVG